MKAEQRKEIETNSLVLAVQRFRKHASGRTAYYRIAGLLGFAGKVAVEQVPRDDQRDSPDRVICRASGCVFTEPLDGKDE